MGRSQNSNKGHTYIRIKKTIKDDDRFILIENQNKMYQPGNYDQVIRNNPNIDDNEVIVEIDGDDWLPDPLTLSRIADVYSDPNIWIANGSFKYHDGRPGFSSRQQNLDNLRNVRFTASHIRTWRAFLWRNIKEEDLKDDTNKKVLGKTQQLWIKNPNNFHKSKTSLFIIILIETCLCI